MRYAIVVMDTGGYRTYRGNIGLFDFPDSVEIYDDREKFESRLSELSDQ